MITRENFPLIAVWLFLIVMIGLGAYLGPRLANEEDRQRFGEQLGMMRSNFNQNFPPSASAPVETVRFYAMSVWHRTLQFGTNAITNVTESKLWDKSSWKQTPTRQTRTPTQKLRHKDPIVKMLEDAGAILVIVLISVVFAAPTCMSLWNSQRRYRYGNRRERAYNGFVVRLD